MEMIDPAHPRLSIVRQCALAGISRSSYYYQGKGESPLNLKLMRLIDEKWLKTPFFGSRRMTSYLGREGDNVSRKRVRRLMRKMGLEALYPRPRTSAPHPAHQIYPYLLKGISIDRPNRVWCADITFIPMSRGFMYLAAVMDWCSRRVLSWRLSNTLEADFCVAAVEEALARYGRPDIFNTDQGSQFTSLAFRGLLQREGIQISMDGRGAWRDNVSIHRTAVVVAEVRVRLPQLFRGRGLAPRGTGRLDRLLQLRKAPLRPGPANPG
jgi:putative transposase